jgi:hypothetical protein
MADGWVDLRKLPGIPVPECGVAKCRYRARYVDPSGVGWCYRHRSYGLHEPPDFQSVRVP